MKFMRMVFIVLAVSVSCSTAFAQIQSNGTGGGAWSSGETWKDFAFPTGSESITIMPGDSIVFDLPVVITGTIINQSAKKDSIGESGSLTFANGSLYIHDVNRGYIPKASWVNGSECRIIGVVDTSCNDANQNFDDFTWNCPNQTANLNVGWNGNTISGNLNVISTGATPSALRLTSGAYGTSSASPNVITIKGVVNLTSTEPCYLTGTGSGSPDHYVKIIVEGDLNCTGASSVFQLANGSGGICNWYVNGNVAMACSTFSSNSTATKPDSLIFAGTERQTFTRTTVTPNNMRIAIQSGAIVDMGTSDINGGSALLFTLYDGGTLVSGHALGINGNITTTGTKTFGTGANYEFNGSAAQITGTLMQDTVNNLKITNTSGVALSQATLINGVLELRAGEFDNTIPFTLGPSGSIANNGGTLKVSVSVNEAINGIPQSFYVNQNYPNPFNPSTVIRFGVPNDGFVSAKVYNLLGQEVATLFNGYKTAGNHELNFDASNLSSGIYLYRIQAGNSVDVKRMILMK